MGLDANVFCNCLKEGKVAKPPVPIELIYIDGDGMVEMHDPKNISSNERYELLGALDNWSKSCCEHENMHYCREHIGNWLSVRELQQTITEQAECYPTLSAIFPSCNGGRVNAQTASIAMNELNEFCKRIEQQTGLFLTDAKTGKDLYSYVESYDGIFSWDGRAKRKTGFDCSGLFVIDSETNKEYFRSKHFTQKALPVEDAVSPNGEPCVITPALLTDIDSQNSCMINFLIGQNNAIEELQIKIRHLRKDDFDSLEPLKNILKASIETGNPIFWC